MSCNVPGGSCTVFVTSQLFTGNLGGLVGADAKCQQLADGAQLPGAFKAWLSDSTTDARDRLTQATVPYIRVDGIQIADGFQDLVDGSLDAPINVTEQGDTVPPFQLVWTGTNEEGRLGLGPGASIQTCTEWTTEAPAPGLGHLGITGSATEVDTHGLTPVAL